MKYDKTGDPLKPTNLKEWFQEHANDIVYGVLALSVFGFAAHNKSKQESTITTVIQTKQQVSETKPVNTVFFNDSLQSRIR